MSLREGTQKLLESPGDIWRISLLMKQMGNKAGFIDIEADSSVPRESMVEILSAALDLVCDKKTPYSLYYSDGKKEIT